MECDKIDNKNPAIIPKVDPTRLCDMIKLCSVRERDWKYMVWVKKLNWDQFELNLNDIAKADSFEGNPIIRTYSSWHVFIDVSKKAVYLVTVKKWDSIQHQFTWGSPLEQDFNNIFYWDFKIDLYKVEENANTRTQNRTWVKVIDTYNEIPLVDWVLLETKTIDWNIYYKLVLLLHFVVKKYEGNLWYCEWVEDVVWGNRYNIDELSTLSNIAPNAIIVTTKALELLW